MPAASVSPHPSATFTHLHIDLVGPLQYSGSFTFIFTVIDHTSKWREAIPFFDTSAAACAKALIFSWISRLGVPETNTSDCGRKFTSNIWSQLCEMLDSSHCQTTAYHPESNGAVKRLHWRLKAALRTCAAVATWSEELPFVLLSLRAQPREETGLSPAEAVFGTPIVLPNKFLQGDELSFDAIVKKLEKKLWMFLLFPCSGTISAGLIFRPAGFFSFLFSGAAKRRSRSRFSGRGPVFCMLWTGGAIPVSTAAVSALSAVTALEIGPLTSPPAGRRQRLGGALWRPGYTPG
jgi:hypothetical protein